MKKLMLAFAILSAACGGTYVKPAELQPKPGKVLLKVNNLNTHAMFVRITIVNPSANCYSGSPPPGKWVDVSGSRGDFYLDPIYFGNGGFKIYMQLNTPSGAFLRPIFSGCTAATNSPQSGGMVMLTIPQDFYGMELYQPSVFGPNRDPNASK